MFPLKLCYNSAKKTAIPDPERSTGLPFSINTPSNYSFTGISCNKVRKKIQN